MLDVSIVGSVSQLMRRNEIFFQPVRFPQKIPQVGANQGGRNPEHYTFRINRRPGSGQGQGERFTNLYSLLRSFNFR
jgi:hypothetical protein